MEEPGSGRRRQSFEGRLLWLSLLGGLPALVVLAVVAWQEGYPAAAVFSVAIPLVIFWIGAGLAARDRAVFSLYTLSNLLEAAREGDFSLRGRRADREDALGQVVWEVNTLTETMRDHRLQAHEANVLLGKVIAELEIAVFAFDYQYRLSLVNRAGANLMARDADQLRGATAERLGLDTYLEHEGVTTVERAFPGRAGRWELRHGRFREGGLPHHLLVVTDLSRALRAEERKAWQRLIRVMGHELNNSLAPIKSMAGTLVGMLDQDRDQEWEGDVRSGLSVIAERAEALSRFVAAYGRLARLPDPERAPHDIGPLIRRVASLSQDDRVQVEGGPEMTVRVDADQMEQALINLIKNALEAGARSRVVLRWRSARNEFVVEIEDDGPGLANPENVFVPFFTTKPGGSGVGLVLARQIAEAHEGGLVLANRIDADGCLARMTLPVGG